MSFMNRRHRVKEFLARGDSRNRADGFTLIEVCLALMIVGAGVLVLFGLFPAGLKEAEYSVGDTRVALFADFVMSGLHANARNITDWDDWSDIGEFRSRATANVVPCSGSRQEIVYPADSDPTDARENIVKYTLEINEVGDYPGLRCAVLNVSAGKHGWMGTWFRTEFFYSGMK